VPAIVEADDDGMYVLKFRGAGQGPKALIAELLAGEIGRAGGQELADRVQQEVAAIAPISPRVVTTGVPAEPVLQGALLTGLQAVREEVFGSTVDDD
jgi:hypothetical protein